MSALLAFLDPRRHSKQSNRFRLQMCAVFLIGLSLVVGSEWYQQRVTVEHVAAAITTASGRPSNNAAQEHKPTPEHNPLTVFIYILGKIGEAMLIAPFLALVVDRAAKVQLLKEFGENISLHIMGRYLPRELRDHMRQYLEAKFVRRNWEITYTIEPWGTSQPEYVRVRTSSQYEIENCTDTEAEYEFRYSLDNSRMEITSEIVTAGYSSPNLDKFQAYTKEDLAKKIRPTTSGKLFSDIIKIQPCDNAKSHNSAPYRFLTESIECFSSRYTEHFTPRYPVLNTTMTVLFPKTEFHVDVYLSFAESAELDTVVIEGGQRWFLKKPILPGQALFASWRPNKESRPELPNGGPSAIYSPLTAAQAQSAEQGRSSAQHA